MNIALIAHDGKKAEMVGFVLSNFKKLEPHKLWATGTTGTYVEKAGLEINKLLSGPKGGDAQIAALCVEGKIGMVIFFRDPLDRHPHEPDVQMLLRICDVHNVALATNPRTDQYLLDGIDG